MFVVTEAGPEVVFWEVVIVFRQARFWMFLLAGSSPETSHILLLIAQPEVALGHRY